MRASPPTLSERELEARPSLSPHAQLRHGSAEARALVVLPERAVELAGSAEEIVRLCDGTRSARAVAQSLRDRYPDAEGLEEDVRRFLAQMRRLGVLELHGD